MKLLLCAVLDKKVGAFTPPQAYRSKGEALRSFMDACKDEKSQFARHAADYVFCSLGVMNDETGDIVAKVEQVVTALECVNSVE